MSCCSGPKPETTALKRCYMTKIAIVNPKALYAAGGGIAAAAIAIFFLVGPGNIGSPGFGPGNQNEQPAPAELQVSIKDIIVEKLDEKNASVRIEFGASNPNKSPILFETIHYTIYVGDSKMTSGDIGAAPEGFVASSGDLTLVPSESSITLKNSQIAIRNNLTGNSWDRMVQGDAEFEIEGIYSYRFTTRLETTGVERDFVLTFP